MTLASSPSSLGLGLGLPRRGIPGTSVPLPEFCPKQPLTHQLHPVLDALLSQERATIAGEVFVGRAPQLRPEAIEVLLGI